MAYGSGGSSGGSSGGRSMAGGGSSTGGSSAPAAARQSRVAAPGGSSLYESSFTVTPPPSSQSADEPVVIGQSGEVEVDASFFIDHDNPETGILSRELPNPLFDLEDVNDLDDSKIFELLPKEPKLPNLPPISLELFSANWSRVINFGGVTDLNKDPRIESIGDWAETDNNGEIIGPGEWSTRHKWPATSTLDPTYMFFTADPALFYANNIISHYQEDENGVEQPVLVPDEDIRWELDGKVVSTGWFLNLSALDRTVESFNDQAVVVPRTLACIATNEAGELRKDLKFAAINSDDAGNISNVSGLGDSEVDNFSSQLEGSFVPDNDVNSETYRGAVFVPDPRYEPRDIYIRFEYDPFDKDRFSRRRKLKKATAEVRVDGERVFRGRGTTIQDKWKRRDRRDKRHQDALDFGFNELFNNNGRIKKALRNERGDKLEQFGIFDLTQGRRSALLYDEVDKNKSRLIKFQKPPGPFSITFYTKIRTRRGGWFSKKINVVYEKEINFQSELALDTAFNASTQAVQPIDLGVFKVSGTRKEDNELP